MNILKFSTMYFGAVFGAGFFLALIRIPLLVPRFGVRAAELIEMPIMLMVIYFAARWIVHRAAFDRDAARCRLAGARLATDHGVHLSAVAARADPDPSHCKPRPDIGNRVHAEPGYFRVDATACGG
jgi:hypothetical protein